MMTKCPKCGSTEIIPDLILLSFMAGDVGTVGVVLEDPSRKGENESVGFRADVCGNCGYAEFYTKYASDLLNAHKKGYVTSKP